MMRRTLLLGALWAAAAPCAPAQSIRTQSEVREYRGERDLTLSLEFTGGTFHLRPEAGSALYRARIAYDELAFTPFIRYSGERRRLRAGLDADNLRARLRHDDTDQQMTVAVSPRLPVILEIDLGLASADVDLGGLSLREAEIGTGAAKGSVRFGAPNRVPCERLAVALGAAEFAIEQLGNSRCERIEITGGIADVVVDFSGAWDGTGPSHATVKMALGDLILRFPESLGVAISVDRLLAGVELPGFEQRGDRHVTPDFDAAPQQLLLSVDALFGSVRVEWMEDSGT